MTEAWLYQVRIDVADAFADLARHDPTDPRLAPLPAILERHGATLICQYDAFAGYVAAAEREGVDGSPLYAWTKATIEDPAKQAKFLRSFTFHVGGEEVYPKAKADALEADLAPLVGGPIVARLHKYDSNPANNPQPPARYRDGGQA